MFTLSVTNLLLVILMVFIISQAAMGGGQDHGWWLREGGIEGFGILREDGLRPSTLGGGVPEL